MANKPHINLIVTGHVAHGKSTTVGRLLYDTGAIREDEMRKLRDIATEMKMQTFEFAFVMDTAKEERERAMTIDLMHKPFETQKYYFTIIDAPGHRDFVKNMITGASQADAAILVCSIREGEGIQIQTREHAYLLKVLGVQQLIPVINKMDNANYSEAAYNKIKEELAKFLKGIGYKTEEMNFIPISAYIGDNVAKRSDKMPWYKGPTLLEALDLIKLPEKPVNKPLRLPVQDVYDIKGIGVVPVGRVETGVLKSGAQIIFMPSGVKGEVKSVEMHHQQMAQAEPGDNVGFNVRGIKREDVRRGDVVGTPDSPPTVAKEFTAQIIVLNHPTVITKGYTPVFHCHTVQMACQITEIVKKLDPKTGATLQENPDFIKTGDAAIVKIKPNKPFALEKQADFPQLARFAVRDMGQTVAAGVVIDLVKA